MKFNYISEKMYFDKKVLILFYIQSLCVCVKALYEMKINSRI